MSSPTALKRTAFYDYHIKHNARMVDFAGWEMPLLYKDTGIIAEHNHTRTAASIFDVSHMGRLKFSGNGALAFLQKIATRNLEKAFVGQSLYAHICNEAGGILDDVIITRFNGFWMMVCNASNRDKLLAWFQPHLTKDMRFEDETGSSAMVAIQGPKAMAVLDELMPEPVSEIKRYYGQIQKYMFVISLTVFRSGYTGEDGAEIIVGQQAAALAMNYLAKGSQETSILKPAGLGARDTLRMEAGMPLYGHELLETIDPISAGQGWAVDLKKEFIGAAALRKIAAEGCKRKLVGLILDGPRSARQGMVVVSGGAPVGEVTSACASPTLKKNIAMAYVDAGLTAIGTKLEIDLRGSLVSADVVPLPFYKRAK